MHTETTCRSDAVFSDFHFDWNLASEMTARTENGQITSYLHDAAGQLTSANHVTQTDETYNYDANGNRQAAGLTIGTNNQVLADSTYAYLYDAEGNLIRRTATATGSYTVYQYDHRNRMTDATNYTSAGTVTQDVDFAYDVFDRRITKTVDADGAGPLAPVTTHTVYDGQHAWADLDAAGNVVARYLFGPSIDEIAARWTPTSGTAWYVTDQLGSVRHLLNATGAIVNSIIYDSFGNIVSQSNPTAGDRFTFTGREFDVELGYYYYRARYYDASLGRFISQDPIGFAAGDSNLYRYVSNSPLTFVDPSGNVAAVSYGTFAQRASQIANGAAGAALGYVCGYTDGWYTASITGNGDPYEEAVKSGRIAAATGLVLGVALGAAAQKFAIFQSVGAILSVVGGAYHLGSSRDMVQLTIRTACLTLSLYSKAISPRSIPMRDLGPSPLWGQRTPRPGDPDFVGPLPWGQNGERIPSLQNRGWPMDNGFVPQQGSGPFHRVLQPGYRFDRFTSVDPRIDGGRFVAPAGTGIPGRALPLQTRTDPMRTFEVLRPFIVRDGLANPYFGAPGFGDQHQLPIGGIQGLLSGPNPFIREIH